MVSRKGKKPLRDKEKRIMENKALNEFIGAVGRCKAYLEELEAYFDNHMDVHPDKVNWGTANTANYFAAHLQELADRAMKRGEFEE
jgi:hypothetical protein